MFKFIIGCIIGFCCCYYIIGKGIEGVNAQTNGCINACMSGHNSNTIATKKGIAL